MDEFYVFISCPFLVILILTNEYFSAFPGVNKRDCNSQKDNYLLHVS